METARMAFAPSRYLFGVPSSEIIVAAESETARDSHTASEAPCGRLSNCTILSVLVPRLT